MEKLVQFPAVMTGIYIPGTSPPVARREPVNRGLI
jgi:hypothetical protein